MADYSVNAEVKANIEKFRRPVRQAKKIIENYKRQVESVKDAKLTADASDVVRKSTVARDQVRRFQNMKASGVLDVTTQALKRKLASARASLASFGKIKRSATADFNIGAAATKTSMLKAMLRSIPNKVRVRAEMNHHPFMQAWAGLMAATDRFDDRMAQLAKSIHSFGIVFANQIKGAVISNITTAVPIIASMVPAVMAVGNAIGVVGSGATALAASFGVAGGAAVAFGAAAAPTIQSIIDGTAASTAENVKAMKALNTLKKSWQGVVDAIAPEVAMAFANALQGVNSAVQMAMPMFKGMATAVVGLTSQFKQFMATSPVAKSFFKFMGSSGVSIFTSLAQAAGLFVKGLMRLTVAFEPLMSYVSNGLKNMAAQFDAFAARVADSQGLQTFINYVKTNLPLIGQIFGNTFMGIINLFKAFASNSSTIFSALAEMTARFREWSASIGESKAFQQFIDYITTNGPKVISLIGNITQFLIALGVELAPVGAAMLSVANAVLPVLTNFLQLHPAVGLIIGGLTVLAGTFMMLVPALIQVGTFIGPLLKQLMRFKTVSTIVNGATMVMRAGMLTLLGPVGLIIAAVAGLAIAIIMYWDQIKAGTIAAWNAIKTFLMTIMNAFGVDIRAVWQSIVQFFISIWQEIKTAFMTGLQPLITAVKETWTQIQTAIQTAMQTVMQFINEIWTQIKTFWNQNGQQIIQATQNLWNMITQVFKAAWALIGPIVKQGWELLKQIFSSSMQVMAQVVRTGWSLIQTVFQTAWTLISGIVQAGIDIILGIVKVFTSIFTGDLRGMWEGIKMIFRGAMTAVQAIFKAGWQLLSGIVKAVWPLITAALQSGWDSIKQLFQSAGAAIKQIWTTFWNALKSVFGPIFTGIKNAVVNGWNAMKQRTQSTLNAIKAVVTMVWNAVKNAVVSAVNAIKQRTITTWNMIKTGVTAAVNGLKSAITSAWNAIKSGVSSAVNAVKNVVTSVWNAIRNTVTNVMNTVKSAITNAWNTIKSTVMNAINNVRSAVTSGFNTVRQIISTVMNTVKALINVAWKVIKQVVKGAMQILSGDVKGGFNRIKNAIRAGMEIAKSLIRQAWNRIKALVGDALSNLISRIREGMSNAASRVREGVSNMVDRVKKFVSNFVSAGADLIMGLIKGITGKIGDAIGAVKKGAKNILKGAKKALGIGSPSKIFKQYGGWLMDGAAIGIDQNTKRAVRSTAGAAKQMTKAFNPAIGTDIDANMNNFKKSLQGKVQHQVNVSNDTPRPSVRVFVEGDAEWMRAYTNERNADEDVMKKF